MGIVARLQDTDATRQSLLSPFSTELVQLVGKRKRGRPRAVWATEVHKHRLKAAGSKQYLEEYWKRTAAARHSWQALIKKYANDLLHAVPEQGVASHANVPRMLG